MGETERNVWGSRLVEYINELRSQGGVSFSFTGDAISAYENRVELDQDDPATGHRAVRDPWGLPVARTFYKHHQWDIDLSKYAIDRIAEVMTDAGGTVRKKEPQSAANSGYGHATDDSRRTARDRSRVFSQETLLPPAALPEFAEDTDGLQSKYRQCLHRRNVWQVYRRKSAGRREDR